MEHQQQPPYKEDVTIHWNFNWSIPEDVREQMKAGDYFEFQLPGNLKPKNQVQVI